jgi:hypothetical protein
MRVRPSLLKNSRGFSARDLESLSRYGIVHTERLKMKKIILVWSGFLLVFLLTACRSASAPPPTTAEFVLQFDGAPDPVKQPVSVTLNKQGDVYVITDDYNYRIQKFDSDGKFLLKWARPVRGMVSSAIL